MGTDKADLLVDGERLADRLARLLADVTSPVLEVGPGRSSLPAVGDVVPGGGPLVALVSGAGALATRGYEGPVLLVGVDLPFLTAEVLALVASHAPGPTLVPTVAGRDQLVCARYSAAALELAKGLVVAGERSLRALVERIPVTRIDERVWGAAAPGDAFADVDTPEDLQGFGLATPG
jgi:molybdopterin-guanine dinucleotide biosynthesis protein A